MAIDRSKLGAIIAGRARALCSPEGDRKINEYKSGGNNINNTPIEYSRSNDDNDDFFGLSEYGMSYGGDNSNFSTTNGQVNDIDYDEQSVAMSKLPDAIKESLLHQKIDMTGVSGVSVIDSLGIKTPKKPIRENKSQPQVQPQPQQYMSAPSNIDYSIIKAIVNECLNEYFSKNMLNESTSLKTIALQNGNISLVDNKGNIFKAKLEKIGNKNDKK
jgi:hypothetical protein